MSVFVCGALHHDVVVSAPHLPRLDETVAGGKVHYVLGGKGGNQAVAAARMGAHTRLAGRVGADAAGAAMLKSLGEAGVNTDLVQRDAGPSGMSVAIVDPSGGYGAVIVSAANLHIAPDQLDVPDAAKIVLLQNEIPEAVNLAVALKAQKKGVSVVLNAAPARPLGSDLLGCIDVLVVNRVEAADMLGIAEPALDPLSAAQSLTRLGPRSVIVTLGGEGLVLFEAGVATHYSGHSVSVISTHGAGDAFLGAFASARSEGQSLVEAARFGQAAAAVHVSTPVEQRHAITRAQALAMMAQPSIL